MCRVACHALPLWLDTHDIAQEFSQCRVTDYAYLLASRRQGTKIFYQTTPQSSPPEGGHKNVLPPSRLQKELQNRQSFP